MVGIEIGVGVIGGNFLGLETSEWSTSSPPSGRSS